MEPNILDKSYGQFMRRNRNLLGFLWKAHQAIRMVDQWGIE